jgi:hypothetical protein
LFQAPGKEGENVHSPYFFGETYFSCTLPWEQTDPLHFHTIIVHKLSSLKVGAKFRLFTTAKKNSVNDWVKNNSVKYHFPIKPHETGISRGSYGNFAGFCDHSDIVRHQQILMSAV